MVFGCGVSCLGYRVWNLRFGVRGLWFTLQDSEFGVQGLRERVRGRVALGRFSVIVEERDRYKRFLT